MLFYCYFIVILHKKDLLLLTTWNEQQLWNTTYKIFMLNLIKLFQGDVQCGWIRISWCLKKIFEIFSVLSSLGKSYQTINNVKKSIEKKTSKNSASQVESFKNHNKFCIGEGNIWQNLTNFTSFQYFLRVHHIIIRTWLWPLKKLAMPFLVRWHLGKIYW